MFKMSHVFETKTSSNSSLFSGELNNFIAGIKLNESRDFFGCLLVSQIESVEAVSQLDKQVFKHHLLVSNLN